mgnify:CR=1 FL=1
MKNFIPHDIPKLHQINSEQGRTYLTPSGNCYPSVTNVCSILSEDSIKQWRRRVGEKEANRISSTASSRGTRIHNLCEQYLLGNNADIEDNDVEVFSTLMPHLDKIDNIHCMETYLHSNKLQVAGAVDLICEYDGVLSVVDWKTSGKLKQKEWINNYFIQTAMYAYCMFELTQLKIKQLVVIIGVDNNDAQCFIEKTSDWVKPMVETRKLFKLKKGY